MRVDKPELKWMINGITLKINNIRGAIFCILTKEECTSRLRLLDVYK